MIFSDWHVMENRKNKERHYFYGDLSEFESDDLEGLSEVPFSDWKDVDFAELLGNEFEDRNLHSMTSLPSQMLECMKQANIMEVQRTMAMKLFARKYMD